jgi:hypothetical protein
MQERGLEREELSLAGGLLRVWQELGLRKTTMPTSTDSIDLQDKLMRFEGRFSARLVAAFGPLTESPEPAVRARAARDLLEFMASALDIAIGSSPEVDVLDMVTLVALGRDAMARRWGDAGRSVVEAFKTSLEDVSTLARGALSEGVVAELRHVIEEWQEENPHMDDVASVRLSAHAVREDGARTRSARDASGLFSVVRGAARTADSALLLGERVLYALQRLPFQLRIHARIATNDLVTDVKEGILDASRDRAVTRRTTEIASAVESAAKRILWSAALACGALVLVAGFSRLVNRR